VKKQVPSFFSGGAMSIEKGYSRVLIPLKIKKVLMPDTTK
jgi:hypothetical protein